MTAAEREVSPEDMTPDELAASMIPVVCELACLVRDADKRTIAKRLQSLAEREWYALAVVAAAMVPDDRPLPELLGWLEPGSPERDAMLGKAHGRASYRQAKGLPLWGPLAALENEYQQRRKEHLRGAAAA